MTAVDPSLRDQVITDIHAAVYKVKDKVSTHKYHKIAGILVYVQ